MNIFFQGYFFCVLIKKVWSSLNFLHKQKSYRNGSNFVNQLLGRPETKPLTKISYFSSSFPSSCSSLSCSFFSFSSSFSFSSFRRAIASQRLSWLQFPMWQLPMLLIICRPFAGLPSRIANNVGRDCNRGRLLINLLFSCILSSSWKGNWYSYMQTKYRHHKTKAVSFLFHTRHQTQHLAQSWHIWRHSESIFKESVD